MELLTVTIDKPDDMNVILGQSHFVKSVEVLHEVLVGTSPHLRFSIAFCEASGPCLVRRSGNDDQLVDLAVRNALAAVATHIFGEPGWSGAALNPHTAGASLTFVKTVGA